MPASILDLIFLALCLLFAVLGAKRGLLLSLCSLLAVVVALIGANLLADALSGPLAAQIAPAVETFLTQHLDAITAGQAGQEQGFLWTFINEALKTTDPAALTQLAVRVAELLLHPILFTVAFVVVLIAWTFLSHALDLVARLPVLHTLNAFGGLLFGAAEGAVIALVVYLLVRAFRPDLIPAWETGSVLVGYLGRYGL